MALVTKEKSIDGHVFMVTQFPAREGLRIKTLLVKMIAPSLGAVAANVSTGRLLDVEITSEMVQKAITSFVDRLDEHGTLALILRLLSQTRCDGAEITDSVFDMVFAGKYATLYKVLGFVIEVNDFFAFGAIGPLLERMRTGNPTATSPVSILQ